MANREEIRVTIRPDGSMGIEVLGVAGAHCDEITRFLEEAGRVTSKERKPEYYNRDASLGSPRIHNALPPTGTGLAGCMGGPS